PPPNDATRTETDAELNSVPVPPAPPSEIQEPAFPEINPPAKEWDDTIVQNLPEQENRPVNLVIWVEESEQSSADSSQTNPGIPFLPPPPSPGVE
ncbi:MAG: hypothetical protein KDA84_04475, partial [Planctomycetaceae bacterium]|nr:hypothetical protein [Planctomycetaceae bacterium]